MAKHISGGPNGGPVDRLMDTEDLNIDICLTPAGLTELVQKLAADSMPHKRESRQCQGEIILSQ